MYKEECLNLAVDVADCQFWHKNLGIICRLLEMANKQRILPVSGKIVFEVVEQRITEFGHPSIMDSLKGSLFCMEEKCFFILQKVFLFFCKMR